LAQAHVRFDTIDLPAGDLKSLRLLSFGDEERLV
jgi:hypothetical protein